MQDIENAFEIIKFGNQNIETYLAKTPQLVISLNNVNKEMPNVKLDLKHKNKALVKRVTILAFGINFAYENSRPSRDK